MGLEGAPGTKRAMVIGLTHQVPKLSFFFFFFFFLKKKKKKKKGGMAAVQIAPVAIPPMSRPAPSIAISPPNPI